MNLFDALPETVMVGGREYHLRPSFDRVLEAMSIFRGRGTDQQKTNAACWLLIKEKKLDDPVRVLEAALTALVGTADKDTAAAKLFDFEQDAAYIYAAFLQSYGIDLFERQDRRGQKPLHWCAFLALFQALPEQTRMSERISIRATPVPRVTKNNREMVGDLLRRKQAVALTLTDAERKENMQRGLRKMAATLAARAEEGEH